MGSNVVGASVGGDVGTRVGAVVGGGGRIQKSAADCRSQLLLSSKTQPGTSVPPVKRW